MKNSKHEKPGTQAGFSIAEILVVVAIIGLIAAVSLPNFIGFYRGFKMKTSLRQFNSDVRAARQYAATRYEAVKVSYTPGTTGARSYTIERGTYAANTFTAAGVIPRGNKALDESVYFDATSSFDTNRDGNSATQDIIILPNGTLAATGQVVLRTANKIPGSQYALTINTMGRILTEKSRWN